MRLRGLRRTISGRAALLVGASLASLALTAPACAQSVSILRGAAGLAAPTVPLPTPAAAVNTAILTPGQVSASARALANQARAQSALNLAQQAQAAARASIAPSAVPNGLVLGGLMPVANPVAATADTTGLNTWTGAALPTQTTGSDGTVQVTVKQDASRAILSWQTFNVGQQTTLTFDQSVNGVAQSDWTVLNRVVGQIDPATGLRNPSLAPAPSQILGAIKAPGTVLVLNQNGVIFGAGAQVNTNSLIVSSEEIGRSRALVGTTLQPLTIAQRNAEFLNYGLLGYADQASAAEANNVFTFSPVAISSTDDDPTTEGTVTIAAGAQITSGDAGFIMALAPKVVNHGELVASNGQVSLQSGRRFLLQRSEGSSTSLDPDIRGLVVTSESRTGDEADYVLNDGLIESPQGYLSLGATHTGAVLNNGFLSSVTSVARNGFISLTGGTIDLGDASTLWISPSTGTETIPQSMDLLDAFKTSRIVIGDDLSNIHFAGGSLLLAPSANVQVGAAAGATSDIVGDDTTARIFVDSGATFDVSGMKNVEIPASRNQIQISPVKGNELRDTPDYRDSFLNGATVYVDPRLSGVRPDGVAWVGSPLIEAASYYQQVGIAASELMTKGGNISLGTSNWAGSDPTKAPDVIVKQGATFDISGGWVRYDAGLVQTSRLVTSSGEIVDIGSADPNATYIGLVGGFTEVQPRWGVATTYANPLLTGEHYADAYTEGRDAGALTIKGSAIAFDGSIQAQSFAGAQQLASGTAGTAAGTVYGDRRLLQAAPSQLPAGGYLDVQALAQGVVANTTAEGGDIEVTPGANADPLPADFSYGSTASIDADGNLVEPVRDPAALLPDARRDTILLSVDTLNNAGLGQVNLFTSGKVTVDAGAALTLAPGGAFVAAGGRAIHVAGSVTTPGGTIDLQTYQIADGNPFVTDPEGPGSFDVVIDGTLSTRGRWANDFLSSDGSALAGRGFTDGGSIRIAAAPRVSIADPNSTTDSLDISGSILVNQGALLDLSAGGYIASDGTIDTSAKGGNLTLVEDTTYFQLSPTPVPGAETPGNVPGFRVPNNPVPGDALNPAAITARVALAPGTIRAFGFQDGGTFSLTTPAFQFGDGPVTTGSALPLDFFSQTGFGSYSITSYATALLPNNFATDLGGYNAILSTQEVQVGAGQTLSLTQTRYQPILSDAQTVALQALASGGDLASIITPTIAADAADRLGVNLTLGGLTELHVAAGGSIVGDVGSSLTTSKLWNEGTIRLVGGTLAQSEVLPLLYAKAYSAHSIDDFFTSQDGVIQLDAPNALGARDSHGNLLTNAQLAVQPLYLLGGLEADEGMRLGATSVVDLSGASIRDPRAPVSPTNPGAQLADGQVVAGGTLTTAAAFIDTGDIFARPTFGQGVYFNSLVSLTGSRPGLSIYAAPGAVIDLRGAADSFAVLDKGGNYVDQPVWSAGGTLSLGAAFQVTGADIRASGGAPQAYGGTLALTDATLVAVDPLEPTTGMISAAAIARSGFDTFVANGSLTGSGDVTLSLARGFFLQSRPFDGNATDLDPYVPSIDATGALTIDAPYVRLSGILQAMGAPPGAVTGLGSATFNASLIDLAGAVRFGSSVAVVNLSASGDLRLTGAQPYQATLELDTSNVANSLLGQLVVAGDLNLTAAQVYPTTGSSFLIAAAGEGATISFAPAGGAPASTPYSAGGNLLVQAANIVQAGTVRVPIGTLTLGSTSVLKAGGTFTPGADSGTLFAPATDSVTLATGSVTSVSADGLSIPYGTTTDQIEYYFNPTGAAPLTAPPAALLHLGGSNVTLASGATVDLTGSGDLYAYEFVPGTGGSRDELSRFNSDPYSSNNGYQYPDGRQVYAIVPGLSSAAAAAYDPIYSSDYGDLYAPGGAGRSVYLTAAAGLSAGWYTLLPAQYALLPGGMRVVVQPDATAALGGATTLKDGTIITSGYFGDAASGERESTLTSFSVQSQAVFRSYSNIVTTSADASFAAAAAKAGRATPRLPIDAGRLILEPIDQLGLQTSLLTSAAPGGRGALVDIAGSAFDIVSSLPATPQAGVIALTADSLSGLGAQSLLIGGIRTDNDDGTTSLALAAGSISVDNDAAHPLAAPELLIGVAGSGATIAIGDGAVLTASGTVSDTAAGNYQLPAGESALLRLANGPVRLVSRGASGGGSQDPADISIGAAALSGTAILADSSSRASISAGAHFAASSIALGAASVGFEDSATSADMLTITPEVSAEFAGSALSIRTSSAILFDPGTYTFGTVSLDTPGLIGSQPQGAVAIAAGGVTLANGSGVTLSCASLQDCGTGTLALAASSLTFGSGTLFTGGFAGGTALSTDSGIVYAGKGGLDAGAGALAITTPSIVDATLVTAPDTVTILPSLTLTSTGAVSISGASGAAPASGTPGAILAVNGSSIAVNGTLLRATAGTLTLDATGDIAVSGGARLETPGYARLFGDATDGLAVSAPGGYLRLTSTGGNISLDSTSTLAVGGGVGRAGSLILQAQQGTLTLDGAISADAPGGGGSLLVDTAGGFDLDRFVAAPNGFTGDISISTGSGDLSLGAGRTLDAANLLLAANGGLVSIAGTIDTSGVNGGAVGLFGHTGVTLASGALVDAHADGYAAGDTRQASGGDVTLGTDGAGVLTVASGATIDVGARRSGDRLVPLTRNGETFYSYVSADQGGTVRFRAPLIAADGSDSGTVNLSFSGSILGARAVTVEAYRTYDLGSIATDPGFTGVTIDADGQAVLDTGATADGKVNFLSGVAAGTIPDFVQNFVLTDPVGNFGSLAALPGYQAQPGVELDYAGDVELASNWNLAAGTVDVAGAVAAGDMHASDALPGRYIVDAGREGDLLQNFTSMLYRVGGRIDGAAPALTVRAGGKLQVNGAVSDGTFTFGDQTDKDYLGTVLGGDNSVYSPTYGASCSPVQCSTVPDFTGGLQFSSINLDLARLIPTRVSGGTIPPTPLPNDVPYNADQNSAAAAGGGDPYGSAEVFPLLADGSAAGSSNFRFAAGVETRGGAMSVNPLAVAAGGGANFSVTGETVYSYGGASASYGGGVSIDALSSRVRVALDDFLQGIQQTYPGTSANANTVINFSGAPKVLLQFFQERVLSYFGKLPPSDYILVGSSKAPTGVKAAASTQAAFLASIEDDLAALIADPASKLPPPGKSAPQVTATARNFIRTGTGTIEVAAAGDIDLTNGAATYETTSGGNASPNSGYQVGGTAIYTLGHLVAPVALTAADPATGETLTLDPSQYLPSGISETEFSSFTYGNKSQSGLRGILISNPVYLTGGGDVSLTAGGDVAGRRDVQEEAQVNASGFSFIGASDQPWRVGVVGDITNLRVNTTLFRSGVATLGGGSIRIAAGGDVSDLTTVALTSATTAAVTSADGTTDTLALVTLGGGDLDVTASGNVVGGRYDIGSGSASIVAAGSVLTGPTLKQTVAGVDPADGLRLRLADATVAVSAGGDMTLQGITALGATQPAGDFTGNLDGRGFYTDDSAIDLLASGAITIANRGADVVIGNSNATRTNTAVYPGTLTATAMTGDLTLTPNRGLTSAVIELVPSPTGNLQLFAGGDLPPVTIQMDDRDPGQIPGLFSAFATTPNTGQILSGQGFGYFGVLPDLTTAGRAALHNAAITHENDPDPVRIAAGGDILDMILSTPKQARVSAGQDIIDMMFFGQNLSDTDVTRIVAGRDITATTVLTRPLLPGGLFGAAEPALQGNSFTIGGPGDFILEAGRDLGPFLNSAVANPSRPGATGIGFGGALTFGGGVLSLGDEDDPYLPTRGANIAVLFGVAKGVDFAALRETYLDPANLAALPDDLFVQVSDANGNLTADRSRPIYAPILIAWMQANAAPELRATYGTTEVTFQQAYDAFAALPLLRQRPFLTDDIYFNELEQTSIPTSVSYLKYSRGYEAVNTLFPASLGYTANSLDGGAAGASSTVPTGDLDLRLATIQTSRGGSISLLGPGGRILAGSTVSTADQAARRTYDGARLLAGDRQVAYSSNGNPIIGFSQIQPATIQSIPTGYEGILTLRGGDIRSFTDTDLLLNQSRLFTEDGGDIVLWSSNGDLNAGQGPKTSADFPPVVVRIDANGFSQVDAVGGVSGAGIAAFQPSAGIAAPDVFLIAPRGTVDAGDAGVRVSGDLFVAAAQVANSDNFKVGGTSFGIVAAPVVDAGTAAAASAASAAAQQAAVAAAQTKPAGDALSRISVDVQGYAGSDDPCGRPGPKPASCGNSGGTR